MSNKAIDFIFCPLCGGVKWLVDKSRGVGNTPAKLETHKCNACKKFTYTNHIVPVKVPSILEIFASDITRYSIEATIGNYDISVFYKDKVTNFRDHTTMKLILSLDQAVTFNWYKNEELIAKIKKYVIFS